MFDCQINRGLITKLQIIFNKQKELAEAELDVENPNSVNENLQVVDPLTTQDSQLRIQSELTGLGPLDQLIENEQITEILVNTYQHIYLEEKGITVYSPRSNQFLPNR